MEATVRRIRSALHAMGNRSRTSERFQDDLLYQVEALATQGNCVVEIGCFRGGLSAQLAITAQRFGQRLYVIDINPAHLEIAQHSVEQIAGAPNTTFHLCDFPAFAAEADPDVRPSLVLIDGDHSYNAVIADIHALFRMRSRPFAAVFHDFALRYVNVPEVRVDLAVKDTFGADFPHKVLGEIACEGGFLPTEPMQDGHYHEIGSPEGVLIECTCGLPR